MKSKWDLNELKILLNAIGLVWLFVLGGINCWLIGCLIMLINVFWED